MNMMGVVATSHAIAATNLSVQVGTAVLKEAMDASAAAVTTLLERAMPMSPSPDGVGANLDIRL